MKHIENFSEYANDLHGVTILAKNTRHSRYLIIYTRVAYYKRQLATNSLGVHNLCNNQVHYICPSCGEMRFGLISTWAQQFWELSVIGMNYRVHNRNISTVIFMVYSLGGLRMDCSHLNFTQSGHSFLPKVSFFQ